MGAVFQKARTAPIRGYSGATADTGYDWLFWIVEVLMVQLFAIRSNPPMSLPSRDLRRGELGDHYHYYRVTGATAGGFGILAALIGPIKTWRFMGLWAARPCIVNRGVARCNHRPDIIMVPKRVITFSQNNWDYRMLCRHVDFPGHRIRPIEDYEDERGLLQADSPPGSSSDEEGGFETPASTCETPPKRRRSQYHYG